MSDPDTDLPEPLRQELASWLLDIARLVERETRPTRLAYVPEITLRLAVESVPLWDKIERDFKRRGPPYWAFAWAGGLALARHVLDHPELVAGRRVLDVATGSGLVAIAAAHAGADRVVANDIDPFALVATSFNAEDNHVAVEPSVSNLLDPASDFDPADFDVVLAADVFYDRALAAPALAFLERCRSAGATVLIGDPGRADLPVDRLRKIGDQTVPVTRDSQYLAASSGEAAHDMHVAAVWTLA